jgi:hypothetical protein
LRPDATVDFFGSPIAGSYFLDLRNYDSGEGRGGIEDPILVLQGGRNYQVTNAEFDIWKKELATIRGRRSSSIHRIGACSTAAPDQARRARGTMPFQATSVET